MRISDWSSDVCSSDLLAGVIGHGAAVRLAAGDGSVADDIVPLQRRSRAIAVAGTISETPVRRWTHAIDAVALPPVAGLVLLTAILFLTFQAVFSWAVFPADAIDDGFSTAEHTSDSQSLMRTSYAVF